MYFWVLWDRPGHIIFGLIISQPKQHPTIRSTPWAVYIHRRGCNGLTLWWVLPPYSIHMVLVTIYTGPWAWYYYILVKQLKVGFLILFFSNLSYSFASCHPFTIAHCELLSPWPHSWPSVTLQLCLSVHLPHSAGLPSLWLHSWPCLYVPFAGMSTAIFSAMTSLWLFAMDVFLWIHMYRHVSISKMDMFPYNR